MFGEPVLGPLFLGGRAGAGNAVNVQMYGRAAVDGFEKLHKLLMPMPGHSPNHFVKRYVRHYTCISEPWRRMARLPPTKDRDLAMVRRFD
jgi:hypothetical protein